MGVFTGRTLALWLGAVAGLGSCTSIDRPTGPGPEGPVGPHTVISKPGQDTTVAPGQTINFLVTVTSGTGIDSIYTEVVGTTLNFPAIGDAVSPTTFGISVPNGAQLGGTVILRITATDSLGQPGDTALRFVQIQ